MEKENLILGTRGSKLALWQANYVSSLLKEHNINCEIQIIKTQGDKIQDLSFDKLEGKGFFTKEIEDSLLAGDIDFAVHSMKDLPTEMVDGLVLCGVSERVDPRDLLIVNKDACISEKPFRLKDKAIIGTSSARRKAQIKSLFKDISINDLRGNVPTRIRKLKEENYDAIILAKAGVDRLEIDLSEFVSYPIHTKEFVPAPAQGVLAYQCRKEDTRVRKLISNIHDGKTAKSTNVERKVLRMMDGGCHVPLGVYCYEDEYNYFHCVGAYAANENEEMRRHTISQSTTEQLAERMFSALTNP